MIGMVLLLLLGPTCTLRAPAGEPAGRPCHGAFGAGQDDAVKAKEMLSAAAQTFKDAPAIAFECRSSWKGLDFARRMKVLLRRPDLARIEASGEDQEYLHVLDGTTAWTYLPGSNGYLKAPRSAALLESLGIGPLATLHAGKADDLLKGATNVLVREERSGDDKLDLVSWSTPRGDSRLWIDANRALRKFEWRFKSDGETYEQTAEYGKVDLAPKYADDAFTFVPPKGAREIPTAERRP
ncbi:MAG: DUF2092 domain-containing protein [Planctomycetes bacterium]|nr:DUF2092 domain-containing protein [Planctomycetota bacterium]